MYSNAAGVIPVVQVFMAKDTVRYCYRLYDGGNWFIASGSYAIKKSDDLDFNCDLLWNHCILYDFIRLFVQHDIIEK